jgi:hypothetical protein
MPSLSCANILKTLCFNLRSWDFDKGLNILEEEAKQIMSDSGTSETLNIKMSQVSHTWMTHVTKAICNSIYGTYYRTNSLTCDKEVPSKTSGCGFTILLRRICKIFCKFKVLLRSSHS